MARTLRRFPSRRRGRTVVGLPRGRWPMRRYLVVANRTVCGEHLLEHMRGLTERDADGAEFDVVVPATPAPHGGWTEGEPEHAAQVGPPDAPGGVEAAGNPRHPPHRRAQPPP